MAFNGQWMGQSWTTQSGSGPYGSILHPDNVQVDDNGNLVLSIKRRNGIWTCAEFRSAKPLGFGTYRWGIETSLNGLDPNIVLGLFPHEQGRSCTYSNEIDIEIAKWGVGDASSYRNVSRIQHTIWPSNPPGGATQELACSLLPGYPYHQATQPARAGASIHTLVWLPASISFRAQYADGTDYVPMITWPTDNVWSKGSKSTNPITTNPYQQIPQFPMMLLMNLWLFGGTSPKFPADMPDGFDVVFTSFSFQPVSTLRSMRVQVDVSKR